MYNRYIRTSNGTYTRIPQEESAPSQRPVSPTQQADPQQEPPQQDSPPSCHGAALSKASGKIRQTTDGLSDLLRHFLNQFHLNHVDTGDLLLLGLLFLLFREDADEELLVALGLLLIL